MLWRSVIKVHDKITIKRRKQILQIFQRFDYACMFFRRILSGVIQKKKLEKTKGEKPHFRILRPVKHADIPKLYIRLNAHPNPSLSVSPSKKGALPVSPASSLYLYRQRRFHHSSLNFPAIARIFIDSGLNWPIFKPIGHWVDPRLLPPPQKQPNPAR